MKRGWRASLAILLSIAVQSGVGTQARPPSPNLASPAFHHIHMNSPNPSAAIAEFLTIYPASAKVTIAGFEGLRTANDVTMLFTKVTDRPPAPGPDRVTEGLAANRVLASCLVCSRRTAVLDSLRRATLAFDIRRSFRSTPARTGERSTFRATRSRDS